MKLAEKVAEAHRLRAEGLTARQIGVRMGVKRGTVYGWFNDPDRSKARARKDGYRGRCKRCGAPTDGSNGRAKAPAYCRTCHPIHCAETGVLMRWTRDKIIEAIREWAEAHGDPPAVLDWNPHECIVRGDIERAYTYLSQKQRWPSFTTVITAFGSWNSAIEAAGYVPRLPHGGGGNIERRRDQRAKYAA